MLKIRFRDGRTDPLPLVAPGTTIGKGVVNDIVIDEAGVNGFHADLRVDGNELTLSDVNTGTGTFLNGEKISAPTPVRAGDIIAIQGVELEVFEDASLSESKSLVLSGPALRKAAPGSWSLVMDSGSEKGQVIPISEKVTIGRALECDISILEPSLSRRHAELEPVAQGLVLRDLDSSNGTFVNGSRITEQQLKNGDVVQFDRARFIVNSP